MQELIEGVLAVGARFAPDNRTGAVTHALAVDVDRLAVALHVALDGNQTITTMTMMTNKHSQTC